MQNNDMLIRMERKIDKLDERLDKIDVTLAAQHVSLKTHIKRTDLLERQVKGIQKYVWMAMGAVMLIIALMEKPHFIKELLK